MNKLPDWQTRCAQGFDVHAFEDPEDRDSALGENRNRRLVLCGVEFPGETPLRGHSDADVGMHAITDALYGTLADGDIGQHFPPGHRQWKGADSSLFLAKATEQVRTAGGVIEFIDVTLICEMPKIGPHKDPMRTRLARIMAIRPALVSVKATTSEKLGFTGRGEGIAAMAAATVLYPRPDARLQQASSPEPQRP